MIHLSYGNDLDRLAHALMEDIETERERTRASPLEPVLIVVPNDTMASYLKLLVARTKGIAANLRFESLWGFLRGTVAPEGRHGRSPSKIRVAGISEIQILLLAEMLDLDHLARDDLQPIRAYLLADGGDEDAIDVRRLQLSAQLARLFESYLLSRRDITRAWREGSAIPGRPDRDALATDSRDRNDENVEVWQRALFMRLFAKGGPLDRSVRPTREEGPPRWLALPDAIEAIPAGDLAVPPHVHVFGISIVKPALQTIFSRLAEKTALFIYAFNPCREFWSDALSREDAADEAPMLRLFGGAGRESVRILNEVSDCDFRACFHDPTEPPEASTSSTAPPRTLLAQLQHDVLERRSTVALADRGNAPASDDSITFLACPGPRREAETIASEIWELVRRYDRLAQESGSEPLRMNQIAVVLTGRDQDAYRAHLDAAFAEYEDIPHHFIDVPIGSASRVFEAIDLLLALPFSSWTRQDLLRLVTHPTVIARIPDAEPDEWARWLDALMIVHGADHADHEETYIEKDILNWDQGMKRLVLGTFMSGERSGDARAFQVGGHEYLPHEIPLDRASSAARLVVLVRSLIADARFARRTKMTLRDWSELIRLMMTSYLGRTSDQDDRDLERCLEIVQRIETLDFGGRVSFRIAAELTRSALSDLTTNRGQRLADGVAIGPLAALASIPFKVAFIAGLGEGRFPASDDRGPLDVRRTHPRPSDSTPRSEDEYLFLQRLLATRDHLYLSYVSRDPRTGDELQPSRVVLDLMQILAGGDLGSRPGLSGLVRREPLRRYDARCFAGGAIVSAAQARERRSVEAREHLLAALAERASDPEPSRVPRVREARAAISGGPEVRDLSHLRASLSRAPHGPLAKLLSLPQIPESPTAKETPSTIRVPYVALRKFLEDPKEGWMRFVLRLRDDDRLDDPLAREDENFSASPLDGTILLREVFADALASTGDQDRSAGDDWGARLPALYAARASSLELKGVLPTGAFLRAETRKHLAVLSTWIEQVIRSHGARPRFLAGVRFGHARENTPSPPASLVQRSGRQGEPPGGAPCDQGSPIAVDPLVFDLDLDLAEGCDASPRRMRVELSGRTDPLILPSCSLFAVAREAPPKWEQEKLSLRGFLDHAVLSALGQKRDGDGHEILVVFAEGKPLRIRFAPLSKGEAFDYLKVLLTDLLSSTHAYELPFEAVAARVADRDGRRPAASPDLPRPAIEREAEIISRRFGLYFERRAAPET